jgi:hypothetical protein
MALDASPTPPDLGDGLLADRISWAGPAAHGFERSEGGKRLRHGAGGLWSLRGLQRAL